MASRFVFAAACAFACLPASPIAVRADDGGPVVERLPVPPGGTREQVVLGNRIFHGEAA
jgi:hypothetical protein